MDRPDNIHPPQGFIFFARRLNRHRYHLTPTKRRKGHGQTLCGVNDESMEQTMPHLGPWDADKRCLDCLRIAGGPAPEQLQLYGPTLATIRAEAERLGVTPADVVAGWAALAEMRRPVQ